MVGVPKSDVGRHRLPGETSLPNSTDFFAGEGIAVRCLALRVGDGAACFGVTEKAVGGRTNTRGGDLTAPEVAAQSTDSDWEPSVVVPREPILPLLKLSRMRCREARARSVERASSPLHADTLVQGGLFQGRSAAGFADRLVYLCAAGYDEVSYYEMVLRFRTHFTRRHLANRFPVSLRTTVDIELP